MSNSLEQRFIKFLIELPESEWLDSPEIKTPQNTRKADFFLNERRIIAEIKTIKVDQQHKVDSHIDRHLDETGIKVFGTISTNRLFKSETESERFHNKITRHITKNTEEMCRSANDQILQTQNYFSTDASGLLVILNENIEVLDPHVVAYRVCEYLNRKPRSIHYCLLIFESHEIEHHGVRQNQMLILDAGYNDFQPSTRGYLSNLMRRWAERNGSEYIEKTVYDPASIKYIPRT